MQTKLCKKASALVLLAFFLGQLGIHSSRSLRAETALYDQKLTNWKLPPLATRIGSSDASTPHSSSSAPGYDVEKTSSNGLFTASFTTPHGKVNVNLTDDLAAGDTFSGTVEEEPAGNSDNERNQNQSELNGYVVELQKHQTKLVERTLTRTIPANVTNADRALRLLRNGKEVARTEIPIAAEPQDVLTGYVFPTGGQQGRSIKIKGPCNGRFSETDFVKIGQKIVTTLAESPRTKIVRNTSDELGPTKIECHENGAVAECPFRNIGIKLSADKLSLLRGETTKLQVRVLGLAGIDREVPLDLVNQSPNIISMSGGAEQHVAIQPSEVKSDGFYLTDRTLTGKVRGAFVITGTAIWANVCKNGVEVSDELANARGDGTANRELDGDYELCGPGCKREIVKDGMVFCNNQTDCTDRGKECGCNLFEAPKDDTKKKWKWVAGPFPTKWTYDSGMDYRCFCTKKK